MNSYIAVLFSKLMNYKPNNEVKTIIIEKPSKEISVSENSVNTRPTKPKENSFSVQNDKDINFRSILKDLIDTTVIKTDVSEEKTVLEIVIQA